MQGYHIAYSLIQEGREFIHLFGKEAQAHGLVVWQVQLVQVRRSGQALALGALNLDSFFSWRLIYLFLRSSSLCMVKSDIPAAPKYTRLLSLVII
jgi:hypothetical protein